MATPSKEQIELYRRLKKIIDDDVFFMAVMAFAMNLECEQTLIDAIDNKDLEDEKDFYDLINLAFEESEDNE